MHKDIKWNYVKERGLDWIGRKRKELQIKSN